MQNFTFQNPTKIIFGEGQIAALDAHVPRNARVLITSGGGSITRNGVLAQVQAALGERAWFVFSGIEPNPTYELVSSERTKYRESIEITYDPAKISYDQLLDIYWKQIDPTQSDGQFTDIGPSYRAAIFYGNEEEKKIAEASKEKLAHSGKFDKPIVTEILPAMKFYPAEDYHQKYYQQNPTHFEAFENGSGRTSYQKKTWGKSP